RISGITIASPYPSEGAWRSSSLFFYDHTTKQALGFQNPFYLKKAQQLEPKLYNGNAIQKTNAIVIHDSEETLMLAKESRSKMLLKQKDPMMSEKKVNTKPVDYNSENSTEPTPSTRSTQVEVPTELPKVSMAVEQHRVESKTFQVKMNKVLNENERLLEQVISKDVVNIIVTSSVNNAYKSVHECKRCLKLETELQKDFINREIYDKLFKRYTTLEKHFISLEVDTQLNQEIFQRDNLFSQQSVLSFDQLLEINELNAQSQEKDMVIKKLKEIIKSLSGNINEDKIKKELEEIETINIKLDHRVTKLSAENEHLKQTYKQLYDSIKSLRVNLSTSASGSQPSGNTKKDKIQQTPSSIKNTKIEAYPRTVRSSLKNKAVLLKQKTLHLCKIPGKSKKKSHKPKSKDTNKEKLYLLHMDLYGSMRVKSVNEKKYILVIVYDYSRFTWVKCLRSKDEAPNSIIKFLKMIQVGISQETFVAWSPQQNDVVEKRNHTLIEADRTMTRVKSYFFKTVCTTIKNGLGFVVSPLFDDLLTHPLSVDHPAPKVIALIAKVVAPELTASTSSPSLTTVDQDEPSPSNSQSTPKTQPPIIPNDVEEYNHDIEVAYMSNDPYFSIPIPEATSDQS
nr:putative ribonuclease H-like domain-containing protein [Tanacetum cinerariifolium]